MYQSVPSDARAEQPALDDSLDFRRRPADASAVSSSKNQDVAVEDLVAMSQTLMQQQKQEFGNYITLARDTEQVIDSRWMRARIRGCASVTLNANEVTVME